MKNQGHSFLAFNAFVLISVMAMGLGHSVTPADSMKISPMEIYNTGEKLVMIERIDYEDFRFIQRYIIETPMGSYHLERGQSAQDGDIIIKDKSSCWQSSCYGYIEVHQQSEAPGDYQFIAYGDLDSIAKGSQYSSLTYSVARDH